jgi:hypothetical protein
MLSSDLRKQAASCLTQHGILGVSAWIAEVPRLEDLVAQTGILVPKFNNLAICSLAVLDGYEVLPTGKAPHHTIVLPGTSDEELDKLRGCFLIIPNPLVNR